LSKVIAIIESDHPDNTGGNAPEDEASMQIAKNLTEFFISEVDAKRLPKELLPLQSGIGNIANAVINGMAHSPFKNLTVFTEVLQDCFLTLFEKGQLDFASATSIRLSKEGFEKFYADYDNYKKKIVLRPQTISNSPELIRRLGVIAMNTPVEIDIYGHANSTCVNGSRMINGLGGSGDFLRNGKLSIMHTPAARPSKNDPIGITCIVPMVSHVDHTEHDLDVFVTEFGYADVRGMCPRDRAREIINKCAHPEYKPILLDYYESSLKKCLKSGSAHIPHDLSVVYKMYQNLQENGTMRINKW
jgi:acetyl-CoA hydrolase